MGSFRLALTLIAIVGSAGEALAQTAQPPAQPGPSDPIWGENLITPLPKGWKIASSDSTIQGFSIQEFIPSDETLDAWTDMVTVLIYRGAGGAPLGAFFDFREKVYRDRCASVPIIGKRQEISENGYPGGVQVLACARTKSWHKAEAMVYKTLKGKDAAYQVQRAWRLPPSDNPNAIGVTKDMLDGGTAYLRKVFVCDTREPSRPCPKVSR